MRAHPSPWDVKPKQRSGYVAPHRSGFSRRPRPISIPPPPPQYEEGFTATELLASLVGIGVLGGGAFAWTFSYLNGKPLTQKEIAEVQRDGSQKEQTQVLNNLVRVPQEAPPWLLTYWDSVRAYVVDRACESDWCRTGAAAMRARERAQANGSDVQAGGVVVEQNEESKFDTDDAVRGDLKRLVVKMEKEWRQSGGKSNVLAAIRDRHVKEINAQKSWEVAKKQLLEDPRIKNLLKLLPESNLVKSHDTDPIYQLLAIPRAYAILRNASGLGGKSLNVVFAHIRNWHVKDLNFTRNSLPNAEDQFAMSDDDD